MMKANHYRILGIVLFFGLLLAMWGLDLSGVRTTQENARRAFQVLPDLINTHEVEIRRVAIERGKEHLVFERRGEGLGRWQMLEPKDVAAEPVRLEALVRNLRELRKDPYAGTIKGDSEKYGLAPPAATVRLYAGAAGSASAESPIAVLEIGKTARGQRFVRPVGGEGIDVVDARLLGAVDQPVADWREPNVMGVPTFQVAEVTITRRDEAGKEPRLIRAERAPPAAGSSRRRSRPPPTAPRSRACWVPSPRSAWRSRPRATSPMTSRTPPPSAWTARRSPSS